MTNTSEDDPQLRVIDQRLASAETDRANLEAEIRGLRLTRERRLRELASPAVAVRSGPAARSERDETPATVPFAVAEWRSWSRTDAILRMLAENGGALHRKNLTDRLITAGRQDETIAAVSAALAYLARKGKVHPRGGDDKGWWMLGPSRDVSNPVADHVAPRLSLEVTRPGIADPKGSRENQSNE